MEAIPPLLAKWAWASLLAVAALLAPIHGLMAAVGFLIMADFLTGIMAARKRGEPISSTAMGRTVWKCLAYQLGVLSGFALEAVLPGGLPVAKLVAAAIAGTEGLSIFENIRVITGVDLRGAVEGVLRRGRRPGGGTLEAPDSRRPQGGTLEQEP